MTLRDDDLLDLPEPSELISAEVELTLDELIALCEQMLPYWNEIRYANPDPAFIGEAFWL
ncbi:MAG: hypothetical protein IT291_08570 [Deltaproteobacteria bacterium]|nr:hypothetical protein [Deltaproteobacteria bacterium]